MRHDDPAYYRQRALQEERAAREATCAEARERHEELASLYDFRASLLATLSDLLPQKSPEPATADAR